MQFQSLGITLSSSINWCGKYNYEILPCLYLLWVKPFSSISSRFRFIKHFLWSKKLTMLGKIQKDKILSPLSKNWFVGSFWWLKRIFSLCLCVYGRLWVGAHVQVSNGAPLSSYQLSQQFCFVFWSLGIVKSWVQH